MIPPLARLAAVLVAASAALAPRGTAPDASVNTAAVSPVAATRKPAPPSPRGALLAADAALAERVARDGWAAGLLAGLAEGGLYLHPGADLAQGRRAVEALLVGAPEGAARPLLHLLAGGVSADGARGYTWGWLEEPDPAGRRYGRYLAAWRQVAGAWRVDALVRNLAREATGGPPAGTALARGYAGTARPGEAGALREQVFAADRAFASHARTIAAERGYGPAFGAFADPGAAFATRGAVLWGAAAILEGQKTEPGEALEWDPVEGAAAASGDLAWTVGRAVYRAGKEEAYTKYLTIWARQPDGSWRWLLDAGNLRPAAAP